jgi:hypothetical protein
VTRTRLKVAQKKGQRGGGGAQLDLRVRLDRVRVAADYFPKVAFELLKGFRRVYDYDVARKKNKKSNKVSYRRVCRWVSELTGTQIEGAYSPIQPWLPACVITLVGNDRTGLLRQEVDEILAWIEGHRLLHVEVAFDFDESSVVNGDFVYRHLLVGKARHWRSSRAPGFEYFGTRRSPKFARCYKKTLS